MKIINENRKRKQKQNTQNGHKRQYASVNKIKQQ
jgi:hypothetical protein